MDKIRSCYVWNVEEQYLTRYHKKDASFIWKLFGGKWDNISNFGVTLTIIKKPSIELYEELIADYKKQQQDYEISCDRSWVKINDNFIQSIPQELRFMIM